MRKTLFLTICALISANYCIAQENDSIDQVVYLIGNTATREINETHLTLLHEQLLTENNPYTLLHLGDIVFKEGDIFGDGVNIASRIESMGVAGCVFFSESI